MTNKYPEHIMQQVRQNLDLEEDDTNEDQYINSMGKEEIFERVCTWNGLLGYADTIKNWIEDIYEIEIN